MTAEQLAKAKKTLSGENIVVFTCDTDWASDWAIRQALAFAGEYAAPLTVFMTNPSEALSAAISDGEVQGGLHPNFMPDSSQGGNREAVMDYCFALCPKAECYRSHRYYDVNDVTDEMAARGIKYDSNVCTLLDEVFPFMHRSGAVRFPVFFEDGAYLWHNFELDISATEDGLFSPGIKVINFHPMHLCLNTPYFRYTRDIKDKLTRDEWNNLDGDALRKLSFQSRGGKRFAASNDRSRRRQTRPRPEYAHESRRSLSFAVGVGKMIERMLKLIERLGLGHGDSVLVSSDLRRIASRAAKNKERFKPDAFIDGLLEIIGAEGTLLFPTYNWDFRKGVAFDWKTSPCMTGALGKAALARADFTRTVHPIYSFAVCGRDAELLFDMKNTSSFGADGPFGYLHKNSKALIIDVSFGESVTFAHYVEERVGTPYRSMRYFTADCKGPDGVTEQRTYSMYMRDPSKVIARTIDPIGEDLSNAGLMKQEAFGESLIRLFAHSDFYDFAERDIRENGGRKLCLTVFNTEV
jgi:aminoglycoside N3'-acetyltransferase